jgi:hypothetical protein
MNQNPIDPLNRSVFINNTSNVVRDATKHTYKDQENDYHFKYSGQSGTILYGTIVEILDSYAKLQSKLGIFKIFNNDFQFQINDDVIFQIEESENSTKILLIQVNRDSKIFHIFQDKYFASFIHEKNFLEIDLKNDPLNIITCQCISFDFDKIKEFFHEIPMISCCSDEFEMINLLLSLPLSKSIEFAYKMMSFIIAKFEIVKNNLDSLEVILVAKNSTTHFSADAFHLQIIKNYGTNLIANDKYFIINSDDFIKNNIVFKENDFTYENILNYKDRLSGDIQKLIKKEIDKEANDARKLKLHIFAVLFNRMHYHFTDEQILIIPFFYQNNIHLMKLINKEVINIEFKLNNQNIKVIITIKQEDKAIYVKHNAGDSKTICSYFEYYESQGYVVYYKFLS